jgi:hypothetical protein
MKLLTLLSLVFSVYVSGQTEKSSLNHIRNTSYPITESIIIFSQSPIYDRLLFNSENTLALVNEPIEDGLRKWGVVGRVQINEFWEEEMDLSDSDYNLEINMYEQPESNYRVRALFDRDKDGSSDILFEGPNGKLYCSRFIGDNHFGPMELVATEQVNTNYGYLAPGVYFHQSDKAVYYMDLSQDGIQQTSKLSGKFSEHLYLKGVADMTGDGLVDYVAENLNEDDQYVIDIFPGGKKLKPTDFIRANEPEMQELLDLDDFDNDGKTDILFWSKDGHLAYLKGLGNNQFGDLVKITEERLCERYAEDGDDRTDLDNVFFEERSMDFDNDGDLDIFLYGNYVALITNNGDGSFTSNSTKSSLYDQEGIGFTDIDNDGDLDVIVNDYFGPTILEVDHGELIEHRLADKMSGAAWMTYTDIDRDGDLDIVLLERDTDPYLLWCEQTEEGFQSPVIYNEPN